MEMRFPPISSLFSNHTMTVVQIFISDGGVLSEKALAATGSVKRFYGSRSYQLYDGFMLREFIAQNFPSDVVAAYDALRPYAYKADLGRYCLLYLKGGWYFDIGITALAAYRPSAGTEMVYFRDIQKNSKTSWASSTGMVYSTPGNPVMTTAIDLVVENVKNKYYGVTPLCPTGPALFGRAIAQHNANLKNIIGDYLPAARSNGKTENCYVLPSGKILAVGKNASGGNLNSFSSRGTNNYNLFWRKRQVYQ